jgi:hypothetical protein
MLIPVRDLGGSDSCYVSLGSFFSAAPFPRRSARITRLSARARNSFGVVNPYAYEALVEGPRSTLIRCWFYCVH